MGKVLIGTLGLGRGTWGHIGRLISDSEWDKVIMISNDWGKENFAPKKEVDWILINTRSGFEMIKDMIKEKLPDGEIAISIISGSGKEHMALLAALREAKKDFQFVILTGDGVKFF